MVPSVAAMSDIHEFLWKKRQEWSAQQASLTGDRVIKQ
jgi:hypothetical protein